MAKSPRKSRQAGPAQPSFRKPPIDEVVCGARFESLGDFKLPYYGSLWEKFRSEYPVIQHAAPLMASGTLTVDVSTGAPLPRVWFINNDDDELVQFQPDHLYYNWRRRKNDYPRFKAIFPKFEAAKTKLDKTLSELGQTLPVIVEHELTYINHIPRGEGWEGPEDIQRVCPVFSATSAKFEFLPHPKNLAWVVRFEMPDGLGQLSARLSQANRIADQHPLLVLQLSAKGKPAATDADSSRIWFEIAHKWIVNGFLDLTDREIQKSVWKRIDEATV